MAVPQQQPFVEHASNGIATVFAIPFRLIRTGDLGVYLNGVRITSGFAISISGAGGNSGQITFSVAPPAGILSLIREIPLERITDYQTNGDLLAATVNLDFDRLWCALQDMNYDLRRALVRPEFAEYFDANGRQIKNLADPTEDMDVANKRWVSQFIASLIGGLVIGPVGAASAVIYTGPDGQAYTVQSMSGPDGAKLIGFNDGTVGQALSDVISQSADNNAVGNANSSLLKRFYQSEKQPAVIDMHFGTLAGIGWNAAEQGGNLSTTTTADLLVSQTDVPVLNPTIFVSNQLVCIKASDGQHYSAIVKSITGNVLRLDRRPLVPVLSGSSIYPFYRDDAHPNRAGAACIADDAIRQLYSKRLATTEYYSKDSSVWKSIGGATLFPIVAPDYLTPGGASVGERATRVYSAIPNGGVESSPVTLEGGDYRTSIAINPGTRDGGFSNQVSVSIVERTVEGTEFVIAQNPDVFSHSGVRAVELTYSARPGSRVSVRISSINSGGYTFYIGAIAHRRLGGSLLDINRGKHVLLGDSWFVSGGELHNYLISKLNKANVVSKGIPGNRASQLIERFAADVIPENPDFVWVMVGTNDYYASVSNQLFEQQIYQLRSMIQALGAQPIFFTPSVGANSPTAGGGDQLPRSRGYALGTQYHERSSCANGGGTVLRNATFEKQSVNVPANGTVLIGIAPGQTRNPALLRFAATSQTALNVVVDYPSAVDGAGAVDALASSMSAGSLNDIIAPRTDNNLRFMAIRVQNPTGTAVTTSVVADLCWTQSQS